MLTFFRNHEGNRCSTLLSSRFTLIDFHDSSDDSVCVAIVNREYKDRQEGKLDSGGPEGGEGCRQGVAGPFPSSRTTGPNNELVRVGINRNQQTGVLREQSTKAGGTRPSHRGHARVSLIWSRSSRRGTTSSYPRNAVDVLWDSTPQSIKKARVPPALLAHLSTFSSTLTLPPRTYPCFLPPPCLKITPVSITSR